MSRASLQGSSLFSRQVFLFWFPLALIASSIAAGGCIPAETEMKPPERVPPPPTAQQETANVIGLVKGSQHAPDAVGAKLKTAAEAVFERSFGVETTDQGAAVRPMAECFANGCLFNVVYPNRCAQLRADMIFSTHRSPIVSQWPGTVTRTPPIKGDRDTISVTWALFITPDKYPELDRIIQGPPPPPPPPPVPACSVPRPTTTLERPQETK